MSFEPQHRPDPLHYSPVILLAHVVQGLTIQTALASNLSSGWALITHPFHPLKGQRFAILKIRKVAGQEVLSLYDDKRGSLPFPSDWTDQAVRSVIGKGWRGAPPADGELICFANDSPKMYWNNWGRIRFSITRTA